MHAEEASVPSQPHSNGLVWRVYKSLRYRPPRALLLALSPCYLAAISYLAVRKAVGAILFPLNLLAVPCITASVRVVGYGN